MSNDRQENTGAGEKSPASSISLMQILPLDMTEIIQYEQKIQEIVGIGPLNGPLYMRDFLNAVDAASKYYSQAIFEYEQARKKAKQQYSIAKFERSEPYFRTRGIKATDGARESYADMDAEYMAAAMIEAKWKAIVEYLGQKVQIFDKAHDDSKKIYDKTTEPKGSRSALPSGG